MKLLVDEALSPHVAEGLRAEGFEATHVRDYHLARAPDAVAPNPSALVSRNRLFGIPTLL